MIFFFKQKTAYEMRISDWSSDVCSSDLAARDNPEPRFGRYRRESRRSAREQRHPRLGLRAGRLAPSGPRCRFRPPKRAAAAARFRNRWPPPSARSEEHTSELPSLMRISYAVFCLKKKKEAII